MSNPGTNAQGILTKAYIISATHGRGVLPVADTFSFGNKFGTSLTNELGTPAPILNAQVYNGADLSFDIYETDIPTLYALLMDVNPTLTQFAMKPELMYQCKFNMIVQHISAVTGKVFEAMLLEQCFLSDSTESGSRSADAKVTFKGTATVKTTVFGLGVQYTRIVNGTYYSTADDAVLTGSSATLAKASVAIPLPGLAASPTTQTYLAAFKNRVKQDASAFTVSGTSFTATNTPSSYDCWDLFTAYLDA